MIIPLTQILVGEMKPQYEEVVNHNRLVVGEKNYQLIEYPEPVLDMDKWTYSESAAKALVCDFLRFRLASKRDAFFYADLDCTIDEPIDFDESPFPYFVEYSGSADSFVMAHNGGRKWFIDFWANMKYRMYVYSWQRKSLRNIDYNKIEGCFNHLSEWH